MAGFVKNAILQGVHDEKKNVEEVARLVNVSTQTVEADVKTGIYINRWVEEFGSTIYFWSGLDVDIEQRITREHFERLMVLFRQDQVKYHSTIEGIKQLRPQNLEIPRPLPGGDFKTPYFSFFTETVYINYRQQNRNN